MAQKAPFLYFFALFLKIITDLFGSLIVKLDICTIERNTHKHNQNAIRHEQPTNHL